MLNRLLLVIIRLRLIVYVASVMMTVAGVIAATRLPIDALPNLSENQLLIYSRWPDHMPAEIYEQITKPLADSLRQVDGVVTVRGSSDVGFSLLYVIFNDTIQLEDARRRIAEQLQRQPVTLPAGVEPHLAPEGIATGQIVWYTLHGHNTDLLELRSWQDEFIAPRIRAVRGVAEVASVGGFEPEMNVDLNAQAMLQHGLALEDVWPQLEKLKLTSNSTTGPTPKSSAELCSLTEQLALKTMQLPDGRSVSLGELANVALKPAPRFGAFEQEGSELVAGVVHMQPQGNTLSITQAVLEELRRVQRELPDGWICVPCYDREHLIYSAIATVTKTLLEAMVVTGFCIVLVMHHWRASLVIALTLPLAVLGALLGMAGLPAFGQQINANIMSLAGIAISVGILVDAAVVIVENVNYRLHHHFGSQPVIGNTDELVAAAAAQVARPALMAITIMIVSFLPLFALGGLDGQMMRPLLWTKTFTLLSVILLALTLVPCLARDLMRGSLRSEGESRLLRGIRQVYEPMLTYSFYSLAPVVCMLGFLAVLASAACGNQVLLSIVTVTAMAIIWSLVERFSFRIITTATLLLVALTAHSYVRPISLALRLPLDEGMIMDMPITVPSTNIQQATDDLKARDMVLCRFPEVGMVSGKVGRAETAFDPAPIDMIETMVEFRPQSYWPRRRLMPDQAWKHANWLLSALVNAQLIEPPSEPRALIDKVVEAGAPRFNAILREVCWQTISDYEVRLGTTLSDHIAHVVAQHGHKQEPAHSSVDERQAVAWLQSQLPGRLRSLLAKQLSANTVDIVVNHMIRSARLANSPWGESAAIAAFSEQEIKRLSNSLKHLYQQRWSECTRTLNRLLEKRAPATWNQVVVHEIFQRVPIIDEALRNKATQILAARYLANSKSALYHDERHAALPGTSELPLIDPQVVFDQLMNDANKRRGGQLWLWSHTPATLTMPNGEMDLAVQMPGWANVWTRPIQNRIDMLTTGVNAEVGIRVSGDDLNLVVSTSEEIAQIVTNISGASGVIADPIRGKDYVEFVLDKAMIEAGQLNENECQLASQAATVGKVCQVSVARNKTEFELMNLRVTLQQPTGSTDPLSKTLLPIRLPSASVPDDTAEEKSSVGLLRLQDVGAVRHFSGPATIKSTDGRLSNYVRLNVLGRSAIEWVKEARLAVEAKNWPAGIRIEWTGQFEHAMQTRSTLQWIMPCCLILIVGMIWITFRDVADTLLILLTLPGALIGAILAQWWLALPISLSVVVGYISCLGMAAATGMVMIVYLRDAIEREGDLSGIASQSQLERAVIRGAVHRLRPKVLTEVAMICSLVPLFWSTGTGADVIRPMAAPVLGGILIADEVVDLLIPALFFRIRRRRWVQKHQVKSPSNDS